MAKGVAGHGCLLPVGLHGCWASLWVVAASCGFPWLGGVVSGQWWLFSWVVCVITVKRVVGHVLACDVTCHIVVVLVGGGCEWMVMVVGGGGCWRCWLCGGAGLFSTMGVVCTCCGHLCLWAVSVCSCRWSFWVVIVNCHVGSHCRLLCVLMMVVRRREAINKQTIPLEFHSNILV